MTEQTPQDTPIGLTRLVGSPGAPPGIPRGLGRIPDLSDQRDYHFAYDPSVTIAQLPPAWPTTSIRTARWTCGTSACWR
jgi:hypothetical protein